MINRSFWRLLGYLRAYRLNVALSILSNILMAVFTVLSIPLISPFLELIFQAEVQAVPPARVAVQRTGFRAIPQLLPDHAHR